MKSKQTRKPPPSPKAKARRKGPVKRAERKTGYTLAAAARTECGPVRSENEDALFCDANVGLFIVADGMGGHAGGAVASQAVVAVLPELLRRLPGAADGGPADVGPEMIEAVCVLSTDLCRFGLMRPALAGLGSTAIVLQLRDGIAHVIWAGDSRAYRLRGAKLECISEDQTVAAALVRGGHLTARAARNHPLSHALEEFIGKDGVNPGSRQEKLRKGDRWLLCSDGITKGLTDAAIKRLLVKHKEPDEACRALLAAALKADGSDNVTAIVVDVTAK